MTTSTTCVPAINTSISPTAIAPSATTEEAMAEIARICEQFPEDYRRRLDRDGYIIVPQVIAPAQLNDLKRTVDILSEEEGECGFRENLAQKSKVGHGLLADLVNKGVAFDGTWDQSLILGAAAHVLRVPFRLYCLNYRGLKQNEGKQDLHTDTGPTAPGGPYAKLQCIIPIEDFTVENGATRMLAGTHLLDQGVVRSRIDADGNHPDQTYAVAPAGSLIIYNGNMFHSSCPNRLSTSQRRSLILAYVSRTYPQLCDQAKHLRLSTALRLNSFQRWLLDT